MGLFDRLSGKNGSRTKSSPRGSALALRDGDRGVQRTGPVASLMRRLGLTGGANIEALEERKLLFSLTITAQDVDPATGIGTVERYFQVAAPVLDQNIQLADPTPLTPTGEDFSDADLGFALGRQFESGLRIDGNLDLARIRNIIGQADDQERWLETSFTRADHALRFSLFTDDPDAPVRRTLTRMEFDVAGSPAGTDGTGLDTNQVQINLVLNNQVTASFTGAALRALFLPGGTPALGIGRIRLNAPATTPAFDTVEIIALGNYSLGGDPRVLFDNFTFATVRTDLVASMQARVARGAAYAVLSGPVGATASFFDLFGRPLIGTIAVGVPEGGETTLIDPDGNLIPNFNDGIGRVEFTGTDLRTSFSMWGGTVEAGEADGTEDFFESGFRFTRSDTLAGSFDALEDLGFGYVRRVQNGQVDIAGLPSAGGSVIIGSPWVRAQGTGILRDPISGALITDDRFGYNPLGLPPGVGNIVTTGFTRADQGLFVRNGASIGNVMIHGIVHGSSQFTGAVGRLNIGYLVGSVSVAGDLGGAVFSVDAGMWAPDPGFTVPGQQLDPAFRTGSQLVVGRTVGEIVVGGRNLMDITVQGDVNSPVTKPAIDLFNYFEREFIQGVDPQQTDLDWVRANLANTGAVSARVNTATQRTGDVAQILGDQIMRNDTISNAEFVNNGSTSVRITGELSGQDTFSGEDNSDVFAFAVDGTNEVVIQAINSQAGAGQYFRVLDARGRTIAAVRGQNEPVDQQARVTPTEIRFRPEDGPGVYYLVLSDVSGDVAPVAVGTYSYSVLISGIAATTLGGVRSGASTGYVQGGTDLAASINVLSGAMGALRVGAGINDDGGAPASPAGVVNTTYTDDDLMSWHAGSVSVARDLYGMMIGGDVAAPNNANNQLITVIIGGNLGTLATGINPLIGNAVNQGDLNNLSLQVGGNIGRIDVTGGIGMDQDQEDEAARRNLTGRGVFVRTGTQGSGGNIGFIRTGFHVGGDQLELLTPAGATIGALLTSQDFYADTDGRTGVYNGVRGIPVTVGAGSDVRFVDFPRIDLEGAVNINFPLVGGEVREFVDDAGARVQISVVGLAPGAVVGSIRVLPIDGSQGVAIAAITADLRGGGTLRFTSSSVGGQAPISIGRVAITGDATSVLEFGGTTEIDVLRVDVTGAIASIANDTPNGDIVTIDAEAIGTVDVNGDLGITQVVGFGPSTYAPRFGLAADGAGGGGEGIGGPLTWVFDGVLIDNDFGGGVYRPEQDANFQGGNAYLDDLGSPLDDTGDGLIVRTGSVASVSAGGRITNIILQADDGVLGTARINDDGIVPLGRFDGLLGTIFAFDIGTIDVGNGIGDRGSSQVFGVPGVFAANDIAGVTSGVNGTMAGVISAGNSDVPGVLPPDVVQGIGNITIPGGNAVNAFISVGTLDAFWDSFNYGEEEFSLGDIGLIDIGTAPVQTGPDGQPVNDPGLLDGGNFFRSEVQATNIQNIRLAGYFDASTISATQDLVSIQARGYRNRTIGFESVQFVPSVLLVGRDVNEIRATESIVDQRIDIAGQVTGGVGAVDLVRTSLDVDNISNSIAFSGSVRSSTITTGDLRGFSVRQSIVGSSILVSGVISGLTVTDRIQNSRIEVTGPAGRIETISAANGISGEIVSAGSIGTITVTAGDIDAIIRTTSNTVTGSGVGTISASRDVIVTMDIAGPIQAITAGRNIGTTTKPGSILALGTIAAINAPTGQLYSDVRSGQDITAVTLGAGVSKPGSDLVGRGSIIAAGAIGTVTSAGDFGGDIIAHTGNITSVTITNGSLLPGRTISAPDGTIALLSIPNGNLLGNVSAGIDITSLVVGSTGNPGIFGNVGVNPDRSSFVSVSATRNQLPVGVGADRGIDGAIVSAGRTIVSATIAGGVFESGFYAGEAIQSVVITDRVGNNSDFGTPGSFFAAGDRIETVTSGISFADTVFLAGATNLGADNRPGGRGVNADVIKPGVIQNIRAVDGLYGVAVVAGAEAGGDGRYGTADDRLSLGVGEVRGITPGANVLGTAVVGDVVADSIRNDARFTNATLGNRVLDALPLARFGLDDGTSPRVGEFTGSSASVLVNGATITAAHTGAGQAFLEVFSTVDPLTGLTINYPFITIRNTRGDAAGAGGSTLTVTSSTGTVQNLRVLSNDDASLGTLTINGQMTGESQVVVDAGITTLALGTVSLASVNNFTNSAVLPGIYTGGGITSITAANLGAGIIEAQNVGTIATTGNLTGSVFATSIGAVTVGGGLGGLLSADRTLTSVAVTGAAEGARIRAGTNLGPVSASVLRRSIIAAGDGIGAVTIAGEMFDSAIAAGLDTGRDATFEGTGLNLDSVSGGSIASVTIGGDFRESDIVAGLDRGADRFFGTVDDRLAGGRSTIGPVTIAGSNVGSTRGSESYRIASTGTVGTVRIGGQTFTGTRGNFALQTQVVPPSGIRVTNISNSVDAGTYSVDLTFNQPMDVDSLNRSLTVSEARNAGSVRISLIPGTDYTTSYIDSTNTLRVTFARALTSQNLPQLPGRPGAGLYDFIFDQDIARARVQSARFDGDGDGVVEVNDNFIATTQVGDAGDRLTPQVATGGTLRFDLYDPTDLNVIFDNPNARDGIADPNKTYTIRGQIGDHPDHDANAFRFAGDIDLYSVTLQAGQIINLGPVSGAAAGIPVQLLTANGTAIPQLTDSPIATSLPTADVTRVQLSRGQAFLIKQTGTYIIAVGQNATQEILSSNTLNNPEVINFGLGSYNFDVQIFDDFDSGFTASTTSGDGAPVTEAPLAIAFAGVDQVFGTPDDTPTLVVGEFTFTHDRGADGLPNTADDVVRGTNGNGIESVRTSAGATSTISSALGNTGFAGAPSRVFADVDIYHLNGREAIAAGTKYRLTVRLADLGADLGSRRASGLDDLGSVQFGVFDTTQSTGFDDATLLFSPTDFEPYGGTPNTTIADDGSTRYGYDAKGDFFIEFVAPTAQGIGGSGTYAAYIQGIVNNDYQIFVENLGTGFATAPKRTQNILLETNGGQVSFIEAGGLTTRLEGFDVSRLGFTGSLNGTSSVQDEVITRTVASLNALFQGAGFDVRFSTNPGDFEFQEFSTVFLSSTVDPVTPLFSPFDSFDFFQFFFGQFGFVNTNPYGLSERSDPLNANLSDEAVVFTSSLGLLGYVPSSDDVTNLVQSLTAAVARRSGELMGLRLTVNNVGAGFDPLASDSVETTPAGNQTYTLTDTLRDLSSPFDSTQRENFFLGKQRTVSLLNQTVRRL